VIQVGNDKAMVAPIATTPIAADKITNPASILRNLHEKTVPRMLAMRGKNVAGSWLKFAAVSGHFSDPLVCRAAQSLGFHPMVVDPPKDNLR
jgi:hypothetical protein